MKTILPLLLVLFIVTGITSNSLGNNRLNVIIDADTGNEIDDFYAIVRALIEPSFNVLAVNSAQYHTQTGAPENTVQISQDFNEQILQVMQLDIPHPLGANEPLPDVNTPQPSDASKTIVEAAHHLPEGEFLDVVLFGPMTNVASAILQDSSIVPKLRVHIMGLRYDPETGEWNKNEFNTNNDPEAMNVLLNRKGLQVHVMTATTSADLIFYKKEVEDHLT